MLRLSERLIQRPHSDFASSLLHDLDLMRQDGRLGLYSRFDGCKWALLRAACEFVTQLLDAVPGYFML